ncbi:hypothetical protein BIW11_04065 [Tropilaelaps mercedesae]|uniref:Uncharacterized protein n=1 Tax=Tropilaelaps mercedesae TaxID=418985 RepID=A0A1V9XC20_9ACAR|nr:hypothetical protein BIW11_04065 [Tropilaelaps mercedesae]
MHELLARMHGPLVSLVRSLVPRIRATWTSSAECDTDAAPNRRRQFRQQHQLLSSNSGHRVRSTSTDHQLEAIALSLSAAPRRNAQPGRKGPGPRSARGPLADAGESSYRANNPTQMSAVQLAKSAIIVAATVVVVCQLTLADPITTTTETPTAKKATIFT